MSGDGSDARTAYFGESLDHEILGAKEERDLISRAQAGDEDAKGVLFTFNQRLVVSFAKNYISKAGFLEMMDLIQWGNIGLLKALYKFDLTRGFRFSTYAAWWIRQEIRRNVLKLGRDMSLSHEDAQLIPKIAKAHIELVEMLKREPTVTEIAAHIHVTEKLVSELWPVYIGMIQMDAEHYFPDGQEEDVSIMEVIPGEDNQETIELDIDRADTRRAIADALEKLDPLQREIVNMLYGFGSCKAPLSLEQISTRTKINLTIIESNAKTAKTQLKRTLTIRDLSDYGIER